MLRISDVEHLLIEDGTLLLLDPERNADPVESITIEALMLRAGVARDDAPAMASLIERLVAATLSATGAMSPAMATLIGYSMIVAVIYRTARLGLLTMPTKKEGE